MKKVSCLLAAVLFMVFLSACSQSAKENSQDYVGEGTASAAAEGMTSDSAEQLDAFPRKLIYNADLSAETRQFDQAKSDLDDLIAEYQAYVESSDLSGSAAGENRRLYYQIRVPAASLDDFLGRLEDIVDVTAITKNMEDVTGSYIDTEARLNSLEQEEARLLELLDQAETLEEILQLEDRVSQVRYEIESLTAQINAYDKEIEYSTVTMSLRDVTEYSAGSSFGSRSWEAFTGGWGRFAAFLQEIVIAAIWALPFLLAVGVAVVIIVLCARRSAKKKKAWPSAGYAQPKDAPQKGPKAP